MDERWQRKQGYGNRCSCKLWSNKMTQAAEKWKDEGAHVWDSDVGTHNEWWIDLEQQNWKREEGQGKVRKGEISDRERKNCRDLIQVGWGSPECWGGVLLVSGEAGRGLSASDFLSYLSFSSSLIAVIHLLLPHSTPTTAARPGLNSTTACVGQQTHSKNFHCWYSKSLFLSHQSPTKIFYSDIFMIKQT